MVRAEEGSIHEVRVEERSDLDNLVLPECPHLTLEQLNELRLTQLRRPLHPQSGRARLRHLRISFLVLPSAACLATSALVTGSLAKRTKAI